MSRPPSGPVRVPAGPVLRVLAAALLAAFTGAHAAKNEAKMEKRDLRREMAGGEDAGRKPGRGDKDSAAATQKSRAEEASARGLERLRDQLAVEDDAEWAVILERINRVTEARGTLWKGSSSGKPGSVIAEKGKKSSRSANPEQDSLRYAIRDNLPDAEVKARLARARHVHEQAEARLQQAQSDLRAVLTLRQEAIAVLAGLLPP